MATGKSLELSAIKVPAPVLLSEQKHANRKVRRGYQLGSSAHAMSKKVRIPKVAQMPATNVPFVKESLL